MNLAGIDLPKFWPVNAASIFIGLYRGWDGSIGKLAGDRNWHSLKHQLAFTITQVHNEKSYKLDL